jgi:hypothetical protein
MTVVLGSAVGSIDLNTRPAQASVREMVDELGRAARATDTLGDQMGTAMRQMGTTARTGAQGIGQNISGAMSQAKTAISGEMSQIGEGIRAALPASLGQTIGLAFGGALIGSLAGVGAALQANVQRFTEQGVALGKLSTTTGIAARDLSALSIIARENEISFDTLRTSMTRFSRVIADTKGSTANVKEEFLALADQFKNMADGPAKAELALQMFGRAGADLIPILNMGREGLAAYTSELERAGVIMDEKMVAAANRLDDAQDRLNRSSEAVGNTIGANLVPVMASWAEAADFLINSNANLITKTTVLQEALRGSAVAASFFSGNMYSAANASLTAAGAMNVMTAAALNAQVAYAAARKASADWAAANNNVASAGAVLGGNAEKQYDREQRMLMVTRDGNRAYADRVRAMNNADREQVRLARSGQVLSLAEQETAEFADKVNASFERQAGGAGKAAKAKDDLAESTDKLADAEKRLEDRTRGISGAMSGSLEPMSAAEKFQTAWRVATGETTIAQLEQDAAVKGVMKALDAGQISQADALKTLLALRAGYLDFQGAMAQAGGAAQPFAADVDAIKGVTVEALQGIRDLSLGFDSLPQKGYSLGIQVIGKEDLEDAYTRMAAIKDRNVRLNVEILGNTDLLTLLSQLGGGGPGVIPPPAGGAPAPAGTGAPASTGGGSSPAGQDAHERGSGRQGVQSVNVVVDRKVVASAAVDGGAEAAGTNRRRSYRGRG